MIKKIIIAVLLVSAVLGARYAYKVHVKYNFEEVTENKVYKSGTIPPDEIANFVKEHNIKSVVDLRYPGTGDDVNNPEVPEELIAEKLAVAKIEGVNYFNNGSDQVPAQHNLDYFFEIMDNPDNYPVLLHCYHGVGRAEMYTALYRIEYENIDRDEARKQTRFLTKWSSFDLGKPKGDYLHNYEKRVVKNK
jgi:protein tyrosine/serine phosphatase